MVIEERIDTEATVPLKYKDLLDLCRITLESHLGIKILITKGGPSCSDPAGEIDNYIGFRDKRGNAFAVGIDCAGNLRLIHPK